MQLCSTLYLVSLFLEINEYRHAFEIDHTALLLTSTLDFNVLHLCCIVIYFHSLLQCNADTVLILNHSSLTFFINGCVRLVFFVIGYFSHVCYVMWCLRPLERLALTYGSSPWPVRYTWYTFVSIKMQNLVMHVLINVDRHFLTVMFVEVCFVIV